MNIATTVVLNRITIQKMKNGGTCKQYTTKEGEEAMKALITMDDTCKKLQSQGYDQEAMDCMQLGLLKRHNIFGPNSSEFLSYSKLVVTECNNLAMKKISFLGSNKNFDEAVEFLHFALKIAKQNQLAVTLRNIAQLYTHKGEYVKALKYLERAVLAVEETQVEPLLDHQQQGTTTKEVIDHAKTHLNACAILSRLGKHSEALAHANNSIGILEQAIKNTKQKSSTKHLDAYESLLSSKTTHKEQLEQDIQQEERKDISNDGDFLIKTTCLHEQNYIQNFGIEFIEVLAISYYNAGVEAEHLGNLKNSYHLMKQGVEIAQFLDDGSNSSQHIIATSLKESCQAIMKTLFTIK
jgi:hypothetical protein